MSVLGREDIIRAHERIRDGIHRTPVLTNRTMNELVGARLYFKPENLQKVGAFKARGALNAVRTLMEEGPVEVVATHSSGNHAQALARAAAESGIKAVIVMPRNAPAVKKSAVLGYGAEVVECEPTLIARETTLSQVLKETGAVEVHPYNDYYVIAGQATAAKELIEDVDEELDAIISPVGGGGLLSGTILSGQYFSGSSIIYAAEPEGANDAYLSFQKGEFIPSEDPDTIADGLLTSLGDKTWPIIQDGVKEIITVTDDEILAAMRWMWERMKLVVEPSGAVTLAALLKEREKFKDQSIGVLISGGNVDVGKMLEDYYS